MKKILSIALSAAVLLTILSVPAAAAGKFSYGDLLEQDQGWKAPATLGGDFEHPSLWNFTTGSSLGGGWLNEGKIMGITSKECANGRRSLYVTHSGAEGTESENFIYHNDVIDWKGSLPLTDWSYCNRYFFMADVKTTPDFKGYVYVGLTVADGDPWSSYGSDGSTGEYMLFDNTDNGYQPDRGGAVHKDKDFTNWTRVSGRDFSENYVFGSATPLDTILTNGTKFAVRVVCTSGTIWIDNIDLWNNDEYNHGNKYPEYTPDVAGGESSDGSIAIDGFETDSTDDKVALQYRCENSTTEAQGVSFTTDSANVYRGTKALQVTHSAAGENTSGESGHGFMYINIPQSFTNTLDLTTSYHVEVAMKGTEDASVRPLLGIQDGNRVVRPTLYNGEFALTTNGYNFGSIDTDWELYNTSSFYLTGASMVIKLYFVNKSGTTYFDDVRLVPDLLEEKHGKITGNYNAETGEYTWTAVADKDYQIKTLSVTNGNPQKTLDIKSCISDKTDVYTTVYTWKSTDIDASFDQLQQYKWIQTTSEFVEADKNGWIGDARGDSLEGEIDILDLMRLKKYLAKSIDFKTTDIDLFAVDFNSDGKVDTIDLATMKKALLDPDFLESLYD